MNENELKNPTEYYRAKPFWSLNGDLNEEEMFRQVDVFKKMGFGGVYLHSRSGLETKYLGEKWLSLIKNVSAKLAECGMEAYLYDEDRWPSGTCGGKVTEKPEYRSKSLVVEKNKRGDWNFYVRFIGTGDDMISYRLAEGEMSEGETPVGFSVKEQAKEPFYNGNTYVDLMNKEAVEYFFKTTHEKYYASMGEMFGKEIKGVFTDEPHRGCFFNGFGQSGEDALQRFPYSGEVFARYTELFGEDVGELLPEIAFRYSGEEFSRAAYRYAETCLDLFINSFFKPYAELCKKYGINFTGHLLNEDNLAGQALMCGDLAACYYYMDEPGIDNLGSTATHFSAVKTCASVASQFGKKRTVSELYGATGWQTPFVRYKAIGDWQAVSGINSRCPHLSWYTMKGESKRDYPASISVQSAWWEDYRYIEDYYARFSLALSGENLAETLVIHPVESIWGLPRFNGFVAPFKAKSDLFCEIERKYRAFGEALARSGVEFDYGSEFLIKTLAEVDKRTFLLGNKKYKRVVAYGLYSMRKETFDLLKTFSESGGEVIFGGGKPTFIGGDRYDGEFFGSYFDGDETAFAESLKKKQNFPVYSDERDGVVPRIIGKSRFSDFTFALVNTDRTNGKKVKLNLKNGFSARVFDPRTGEIDNGRITCGEFYVNLCESGEKIFFIDKTSDENENEIKKIPNKAAEKFSEVSLPREFGYELSEPNILLLDRAEMTVNDVEKGEKEVILHDDDLRISCGISPRGRNMYQPWFKKEKCAPQSVNLKFSFFIDEIPSKISLIGEDLDKFVFTLNETRLDGEIKPAGLFDICFSKIEIPENALKPGENVLEAKCEFCGEPALENFYLAGNFGVKTDGTKCTISKLPEKLKFGDVCAQGMPFYGGKIVYKLPLEKGEYVIKIAYSGTTAKVGNRETDGFDNSKMLSFPPYSATFTSSGGEIPLELTLSRKNVFGPLHRDVADPPSTVPVHFRLQGEHRREEYVFIENGIMNAEIRRILK